jgi:hypothetical protein
MLLSGFIYPNMPYSLLSILLLNLQKEFTSPLFSERFRQSPKDFTRNRILTIELVTVFTLQFITQSLTIELFDFWFRLTNSYEEFVTKQAWSLARRKLKHEAFIYLNQTFYRNFYHSAEVKTWRGRRLLIFDGSSVELPNQKELIEHFGKTSNQKNHPGQPTARTMILYDPLNDLILESKIEPYRQSEKQMVEDLLAEIAPQELLSSEGASPLFIYDKGFARASLFLRHEQRSEFYVMACKQDFCLEVMAFLKSGKTDEIIHFALAPKDNPSRKSSQKANVEAFGVEEVVFRVIRIEAKKGTDAPLVLVTNLLDADHYPASEIAQLYQERWDIEEGIKSTKLAAQIENFSGKTPEIIFQDFFARSLVYNIASLAKREAENSAEVARKIEEAHQNDTICQVNQAIAIGLVKRLLPLFLLGKISQEEFMQTLLKKIQKNLLYDSKNRTFERRKSARKHPFNTRSVV